MYDCLIPKLKAHRRFSLAKNKGFSIPDFIAQKRILELEYKLEQSKMPKLERENIILSAKVEQLESEAEILKWYSDMVNAGIDTKNLVVEFQDLQ